MQYHIDTIPVWDALREHNGCLICCLRARIENDSVSYFLGGSVMEPDIRIKVNKKGFCRHHQFMLSQQKNKLGHALMMLSHTDEILEKLKNLSADNAPALREKKRFLPLRAAAGEPEQGRLLAESLSEAVSSCVICDQIEEIMARYVHTFLHLNKNDAAFKKEFTASEGVCLYDTAILIQTAGKEYSQDLYSELSSLLLSQLTRTLSKDREDLSWFTQKFDYRNADKPWGNSKDAVERTVNELQGYCIGKSPDIRNT